MRSVLGFAKWIWWPIKAAIPVAVSVRPSLLPISIPAGLKFRRFRIGLKNGSYKALKQIRERLLFPLLGIDSDNSGEFINHQLLKYCQKEQITITRSRPFKKNDNCFVEHKNWTVLKKAVGYCRYETEKELLLLNQLYAVLRLYTNFFQSVTKLIFKERIKSKVKKHYDIPKTPFLRVIYSPLVDETIKHSLYHQYDELNPCQLKRQIVQIQNQLVDLVPLKNDSILSPKEVNLV